jgi:acyl transferase domain-containing protein
MSPIAIIGFDGGFPGAGSLEDLWSVLIEGRHGITPQSRWPSTLVDPDMLRPGTMVSDRLGQLDGVEYFDEQFFAMSPAEAASMDPQQRLLLQATWRAIEHGGQVPSRLRGGPVGVWIGAGTSEYATVLCQRPDLFTARSAAGASLSMLASRLSQQLDVRGPSVVVDAGCCSTAVALDAACRSLAADEVDLAIVGSVNIILDPRGSIALSQGWMLSAAGECRPFDARADGYVRGEGFGVAVLRSLNAAVRDADPILAVIRGTAIGHCGRSNGGIASTLATVMRRGLVAAGVAAEEIAYVEAYGVGLPATDAAELSALASIFSRVQVGSIKANIGHLEWASGCAAIAKLCAMFRASKIPPQIHLEQPIAAFDPDTFEIAREVQPLGRGLALTNSVSLGGLCASLVIGPPPTVLHDHERSHGGGPHVIALSAADAERLAELGRSWAHSGVSVADAAWTLATRRESLSVRGSCVVGATEDISPRLGCPTSNVIWAFSGQGAQRKGMGLELARHCAPFATALHFVGARLSRHLGISIEALLTHASLDNTRWSQPAIFALEYALADTLASWDVKPTAVVGHSVGEIAACVVVGLLTLDEASSLVVTRARLMSELPAGGGMLAIFASAERIEPLLTSGVTIAALNGPELAVAAGMASDLEVLSDCLAERSIASAPLNVSHAFHSPLMDSIVEPLAETTRSLPIRDACIPWYSTLEGRQLQQLQPRYWARQVREPVQFDAVVQSLPPATLVLELGPGATLAGIGRRSRPDLQWVPTLGQNSEWHGLLDAVASLWAAGSSVDVAALETGHNGRVVHGPSLTFRRRAHWFDAPALPSGSDLPKTVISAAIP